MRLLQREVLRSGGERVSSGGSRGSGSARGVGFLGSVFCVLVLGVLAANGMWFDVVVDIAMLEVTGGAGSGPVWLTWLGSRVPVVRFVLLVLCCWWAVSGAISGMERTGGGRLAVRAGLGLLASLVADMGWEVTIAFAGALWSGWEVHRANAGRRRGGEVRGTGDG